MARRIFISYSRQDLEAVRTLAGRLSGVGHEVWIDQQLTGGQEWWTAILSAIRWCDLFIVAVSPDSVRSDACGREMNYAWSLQRPTLPIEVRGPVGKRGLPPKLAELQWITYHQPSEQAHMTIYRAVNTVSDAPTLPEPMPPEPDVPISYVTQIKEFMRGRPTLDQDEQHAILNDVETRFRQGEEPQDLIEIIDELTARNDFLYAFSERVAGLRRQLLVARDGQAPPPVVARAPVAPAVPTPPAGPVRKKGLSATAWLFIVVAVLAVLMVGCAVLIAIGQAANTQNCPFDLDGNGFLDDSC